MWNTCRLSLYASAISDMVRPVWDNAAIDQRVDQTTYGISRVVTKFSPRRQCPRPTLAITFPDMFAMLSPLSHSAGHEKDWYIDRGLGYGEQEEAKSNWQLCRIEPRPADGSGDGQSTEGPIRGSPLRRSDESPCCILFCEIHSRRIFRIGKRSEIRKI